CARDAYGKGFDYW
nr:immunoglobulin heavy chain junction region [Macaca mulatta]MOW87127.1 immunoglobulin heavy chain junction region [Macaca mulatta]MOW87359.1 immunoglobulin heavy chain junction region [Macaca mulatta]MOW87462.1 immunoglobulin heavy chain junction region [Macaca mulatta]MOW88081.1 immunoglobulin heavy chain junction region [Macaca mulatta]